VVRDSDRHHARDAWHDCRLARPSGLLVNL
jgi:hypothetical protein